MARSLPKFSVGEEVRVRGINTSLYDIDRTEVLSCVYGPFNGHIPDGWHYKTAHQPDMNFSWYEESLHKIDDEDRFASWDDCIWKPDEMRMS